MVLADPVDQRAAPSRPAGAGGLGDLLPSGRAAPARAADSACGGARRVGERLPRRRSVTASISRRLVGLELLVGPARRARRRGRARASSSVGLRSGSRVRVAGALGARRCARPSRGAPRGCARTPRSRTAAAAAARRRAARRPPAPGSTCLREPLLARRCGTRRAGARARARARRSGRPSISIRIDVAVREPPPWTSRMSSFSRRTITSSSARLPRTLTPRVKRYGSSSSSSVEKLFEWPLCGVADRNRRCSNRPPRSRTARVNFVSIP